MKTDRPAPRTVDEYIAGFPPDVREILEEIRETIRGAAPGAEESISYRIPAFALHGRPLVYFAAHRKHVGLYPAPTENPAFQADMAVYGAGKGTARFPLDGPIPFDLVRRIVELRAGENAARAAAGRKKS